MATWATAASLTGATRAAAERVERWPHPLVRRLLSGVMGEDPAGQLARLRSAPAQPQRAHKVNSPVDASSSGEK